MSDREITVLHLDSGRELRGGQWQVIRLMRGLRKLGQHNLLLAPAGSPLLELAIRERFKCDAVGVNTVRWTSRMANIVHAHDARSHTMAVLFSGKPVVVSRRVTFPVGRGPASRWKYSRPDLFLAVSETVAEELRKARIAPQRIRVLYDGVPLLPDKWNAKGPVVVPRFSDERKANTLPLEAARLAGAPVVRSTKLETDLDGANLLLYLTYSEGLGSAALLAMSAGIPVIASDIGGLREAVSHGETGLLVQNNADEVAAAIQHLRNDPEKTRYMSIQARALVARKFGQDRMVSETLDAYESVLDAR